MHCYHSLFFSFPLHTYNTKVDFSIVIIQVESYYQMVFVNNFFFVFANCNGNENSL